MPLLFNGLLALVVATMGAILTYFYLDRNGYEDKKFKFAVMVFLIFLFAILFVMYENYISAWVSKHISASRA
ncbi:MAG: hypothetical protein QXG08_06705 [Candidatus Methanomethyliaceae archaeon]